MSKSSFKVGDKVEWVCRPGAALSKDFTCSGEITALSKKTVKGSLVPVAVLAVATPKYKKLFGKKVTTIKVAKLSGV